MGNCIDTTDNKEVSLKSIQRKITYKHPELIMRPEWSEARKEFERTRMLRDREEF